MDVLPFPNPVSNPTASIHALGAFVRAQLFADRLQIMHAAQQVLIPCAMLPDDFHDSTACRPVAAILKQLDEREARYGNLIYEAWNLAMTRALYRLGHAMPPLLREALYVAHGVEEPIDWEALGTEAAAACRKAADVL